MTKILRMCTHSLEWVYDEREKKSTQQEVEREVPVPIVYAFTRRVLSRHLKRQAKTSCVAVLSFDGAGEQFNEMMKVRCHRIPRPQPPTPRPYACRLHLHCAGVHCRQS